jgi:nucleoid-associated protein YgaU
MLGRLIVLVAVSFVLRAYGPRAEGASEVEPALPPVAYVENVLAGTAETMLVVLAAWLAAAVAAAALARAPGVLGRGARHAWRLLVPAMLRAGVVAVAGAQVAVPAMATDQPGEHSGADAASPPAVTVASMPVVGRPVTTTAPSPPSAAAPQAGPTRPSPAQASSSPSPTRSPTAASSPPAPPATQSPGLRPRVGSPVTAAERPSTVTVRAGDSLWSIAARDLPGAPTVDDVAERWPQWYQQNRCTIGPDPNLIFPGMVLLAPDSVEGSS